MAVDSRWVRGRILKVLNASAGQWVPDTLLLLTLSDFGCPLSAGDLKKELKYLADWPQRENGYVELRLTRVKGGSEYIGFASITPRGRDLVDRLDGPDEKVVLD